jgi:putative inorganic carbon (HCO3(-)) transporter
MNLSVMSVFVVGLLGAFLAVRGLFRPFLGLLVLLTLHFVQPGEMIPALAPLRLELIYGVLMLMIVLYRQTDSLKATLKGDPIVRATLLLEAVVVFTIPFAIWRGGAFGAATDLGKMIVLELLMICLIDSQDRLRSILWLLVGFMMWFSGSSLTGYLQGQYYVVNGVERAQGTNSMVGGPNQLAGLLLSLLPFLVALVICSKSFFVRLMLIGCGGLTLIVLLLTGARIALIALVALAIFYVLHSKRKVLSFVVGVVLAFTLWVTLPRQYQQRYLTVKQYAEGGKLDDSNKLRLAIWDAGWRMFLDHPILGVGAGQFPTAYGTVYSGGYHTAWMNPHNLLLQVACELGLVGLVAFGYFLIQVWKGNSKILRSGESPGFKINYQIALACTCMLIVVAVISSVSHTLFRPYWYILAGMVAANRAIISRREPNIGCDPAFDNFNTDDRFEAVQTDGFRGQST